MIAYKEPGVSNFRNVIMFPKVGLRDDVYPGGPGDAGEG